MDNLHISNDGHVIQVKQGYMEGIRASFRKIGVAKKIGNTGKRKGFKETDEIFIHLRSSQ